MKSILAPLLLALATPLSAAYLEYKIGDRTYTIDGYVGSTPFIGAASADQTFLSSKGRASLSLEQEDSPCELSIPALEYSIQAIPQEKEANEAKRFRIKVKSGANSNIQAWSDDEIESATYVYAWIHDGQIVDSDAIGTQIKTTRHLNIDASERAGQLRVFLYHNGKLLKPKVDKSKLPLVYAAEGNLDALMKIRITKADTDKDNRTLLHVAAATGQAETVAYLVDKAKLDPNARTKEDKISPLGLAVRNGHATTVAALLAVGANPDVKNDFDESPLKIAAEIGDLDIFKMLVEAGGNIIDSKRELSMPYHAFFPEAESLSNGTYSLPLFVAAEKGKTEIVSYILNTESHMQRLTPNGYVARFLASTLARQGHVELALEIVAKLKPYLKADSQGNTLAIDFARHATPDQLEKLLAIEPEWKKPNKEGFTPVHAAAYHNNPAAIAFFAARGLKLEEGPFLEKPPLWLAISQNNREAAIALIAAGSSPNAAEPAKGLLPLEAAIAQRNYELAFALLDAGANWPEQSTFQTRTLLNLIRDDQDKLLQSCYAARPALQGPINGMPSIWFANYYQSQRCANLIAELSGDASLATLGPAPKGQEIDRALLTGKDLSMPKKLLDAYGPMTFSVTYVLAPDGKCLLPRTPDYLPDEIQELVEKQMSRLKLHPEALEDHPAGMVHHSQFQLPDELSRTLARLSGLPSEQAEVKPKAKNFYGPVYPTKLRSRGIAGQVVIEFVLTGDGKILSPRAISYTHPAFIEPAITALKKSSFHPAKQNGKPVAVRIRLPMVFNP